MTGVDDRNDALKDADAPKRRKYPKQRLMKNEAKELEIGTLVRIVDNKYVKVDLKGSMKYAPKFSRE